MDSLSSGTHGNTLKWLKYQLRLAIPTILSFPKSNPSASIPSVLVVLYAYLHFPWVRRATRHVLPPWPSSCSHHNLDALSLLLLFAQAWIGGRQIVIGSARHCSFSVGSNQLTPRPPNSIGPCS
jgi:hypothetical protein